MTLRNALKGRQFEFFEDTPKALANFSPVRRRRSLISAQRLERSDNPGIHSP